MPVMICAKCKGQVRDSFHKEPVGLRKEKMPEATKMIFRENGIDPEKVLPTRWCNCGKD